MKRVAILTDRKGFTKTTWVDFPPKPVIYVTEMNKLEAPFHSTTDPIKTPYKTLSFRLTSHDMTATILHYEEE